MSPNLNEITSGNEIVVLNQYYPKGLREQDVLNHYKKYKKEILSEVKDRPIILVIATNVNEFIVKRVMNGGPIHLTSSNYDQILHGRVISLFVELGSPTNTWCIDIDPGKKVQPAKAKDALEDVIQLFDDLQEHGWMRSYNAVRVTSTSRGYHVFGVMNRRDTYENNSRALLNLLKALEGKWVVNKRRTDEQDVILDLAVMRRRGSHVVPYALNRNGLMCMDITKSWNQFKYTDARIPTGGKSIGEGFIVEAKRIAHGAIGLTKAKMGLDKASASTIESRRKACKFCEHRVIESSEKLMALLKELNVFDDILLDSDATGEKKVPKCSICKCYINAKILLKSEYCEATPSRWGVER